MPGIERSGTSLYNVTLKIYNLSDRYSPSRILQQDLNGYNRLRFLLQSIQGFKICIGVVIERFRRKPLPERSQIFFHMILVELRKLGRFPLEISLELNVCFKPSTDFRIVPNPAKAFG